MKHILIITQHFLKGGLETNILTTIKYLKKHDYRFSLVTSNNAYLDEINPYLEDTLLIDCSEFQKVENNSVDKIRQYIRNNNIDVAYIHPFMSLPIGALACYLEKTPYFVFIHGPVNINKADREAYLINKFFTFPTAKGVYGVSLEVQNLLKVDFNSNSKLILNPIDMDFYNVNSITNTNGKFIFIGRLDEDKIYGLKQAILFVQYFNEKQLDSKKIQIIGDGQSKESLIEWLDANVENHQDWVELVGYKGDVKPYILEAFYVFGMGRVALESVVIGKPIILAGYDGLKGTLSQSILLKASKTNFSGRGLSNVSFEDLYLQLVNEKGFKNIQNVIRNQYHIDTIGQTLVDDLNNDIVPPQYNLINLYRSAGALEELAELKRLLQDKYLQFDFEEFFGNEIKNVEQLEQDDDLLYKSSVWEQDVFVLQLEKKIKELEQREIKLKRYIADVERERDAATQQLQDVYNTKIWKVMSLYYKIRK